MKAIEQYFHVVLFIMLNKVFLTFLSVNETLACDQSNESYWAVLQCGTGYLLNKVFLTFLSVYENLACDQSNESYRAVLSCGPVYYAVVLSFKSVDETLVCDRLIQWGQSFLHHTLVILERDGTAVEVANDLPVTLSNSSAAYLQNSAWSAALSSMTGSRIKTKHNNNEKARN